MHQPRHHVDVVQVLYFQMIDRLLVLLHLPLVLHQDDKDQNFQDEMNQVRHQDVYPFHPFQYFHQDRVVRNQDDLHQDVHQTLVDVVVLVDVLLERVDVGQVGEELHRSHHHLKKMDCFRHEVDEESRCCQVLMVAELELQMDCSLELLMQQQIALQMKRVMKLALMEPT
jgi:hypothetical protein